MSAFRRLDALLVPDPEAALRFLRFRAGNQPTCWVHCRTLDGRVALAWHHTPADEEQHTPAADRVEIRRQGDTPHEGDRFSVTQALHRMGLDAEAIDIDHERRAVVITVAARTRSIL